MPGFTGNDALENLLAACAVRIEIEDLKNNTTSSNGSGFFVAPGLVLTCRHVLEADNNGETASGGTCYWQSNARRADAKFVAQLPPEGSPFEALDLALLRLTAPYPEHDCVCVMKGLSIGDNVVCFGFPGGGAGDTLTFESEGFTQKPSWRALKLKKGDAREGFSGSALLNRQTKAVCGILYSRDLKSPETARAIPIELALQLWPEIETQAQTYHEKHPEWSNLLPLTKFVQYTRAYRERLNRVPIALHPNIVPSPLDQKWQHFLDAEAWTEYICDLLDWIKSRVNLLSTPDLIREQIAKVNVGQPMTQFLLKFAN